MEEQQQQQQQQPGAPHPAAAPDDYVVQQRVVELAPGQRVEATPQQADKLRGRCVAKGRGCGPTVAESLVSSALPVGILADELAVVGNNAIMLTEMLQALEEGERVDSSDIIAELHTACEQMQRRLMALVEQVVNEDILQSVAAASAQGHGRERVAAALLSGPCYALYASHATPPAALPPAAGLLWSRPTSSAQP